MFIKKFMSMLLLTATISMTVAVPGHAAMKITDANSWYYLNNNGTLAQDQWIDNYYVDSTGKMTKIQ